MASSSSTAAHVELFSTSILSNHKVRSRHERYLSILSVKKIPFVYHDLASDEEAKSRWRRKARDPQIPGLLVHNEWRGTFDEFEEAVEFGELDLFLKIEASRTTPIEPSPTNAAEPTPSQLASSADTDDDTLQVEHKPNTRAPSHSVKLLDRLAQPRAPSMNNLAPALPHAPTGSGRRKEHDAESFLSSLGISDLKLTEEELNEILEDGKNAELEEGKSGEKEGGRIPASSSGERGNGKYPVGLGLGTSKPGVERTYIPSAEAGIKPLRLARMGDGSQKPSSSSSPLRTAPSARFNTSHLSSKALAAEAQASISSRSFSSVRLRDAISKGDKLEDAFNTTRVASKTAAKESVVGREDLDDLMASLGLNDVKMSEEEAEAFLMDGTIPSGLDTHGDRLGRAGTAAEKARNEAAARDVARKAKEKGYGSDSSRPTSVASSTGVAGSPEMPKVTEDEVKTEEEAKEVETEEESNVASDPTVINDDDEEQKPAANAQEGSQTNLKGQEESSKAAEGGIEATPMQRSFDLPSISDDSDLTKGKSSTSSVATLLKVEVQAPSDDVDPVPEKGSLDLNGGVSSVFKEAELSTSKDTEVAGSSMTPVVSDETALIESEENKEASVSIADDAEHGKSKSEEEALQPEEAKDHLVESSTSPKKEETLPQVPVSPPLDEAPVPPSKVISPPLSPGPAKSPSSKSTSPSTEQTSLSPMAISTSPTTSRRPQGDASLTPRRRAMDLTRSMSSSSSLSEATSPQSTSPGPSPSLAANSEGLLSPKSPKSPSSNKSPKSGTKKFFGLGRRKNSKKEDQESDEEIEASSSVKVSSSSLPASTSIRSQKTLSMILREADEALNGASDDEDGLGQSHDDEGAFALDLDEVDDARRRI